MPRSAGSLLAALAMTLVVALVQPAAQAAPTTTSGAVTAGVAARAAEPYKPKSGVTFNNPLVSRAGHRINRKIMNSIDAARPGSVIRVMSWNIMSRGAVNALLRAQGRGVKLRVLMAEKNATEVDNPYWASLVSGIRAGNRGRRPGRKSRAKLCVKSCRGTGGEAHAKFFLFSKVGTTRNVYIQGSANLTTAAATNQWNDIITTTNPAQYTFARGVYNQMWKDTPVEQPYVEWSNPKRTTTIGFFPMRGKNTSDPVMKILRDVRCKGARNTANGRTRIRVAPDVMRHARGLRIADRLRDLWNQGCDIKIGYTVMGVKIFRHLRAPGGRGPVPMRHLVQDFDGDGEFDRYFHLKAMSVIGRIGGNRKGYIVTNGSGNFSGAGAASDENFGVYKNIRYTKRYDQYIDYWWNNYPESAEPDPTTTTDTTTTARAARNGGSIHTPDTLMTINDELVEGVDPYASMER